MTGKLQVVISYDGHHCLILTEFAEFIVLQLKVVGPEPLTDAGALSPETSPAVVGESDGRRVGD